MKIGVDLDGVVVDMSRVLLPDLSALCGRELCEDDITSYDLSIALGLDHGQLEQLNRIVSSEKLYLTAPAMDGAVETLKLLNHLDLVFVTSRPRQVRHATQIWLRRHDLHHRDIVFTGHGKKIAGRMGLDVFIEDDIGTALGLASEGLRVLLFDHPWNRSDRLPPNCIRVKSWQHVIHHLTTTA